jgi:hypothetical protein
MNRTTSFRRSRLRFLRDRSIPILLVGALAANLVWMLKTPHPEPFGAILNSIAALLMCNQRKRHAATANCVF